MALVSRACSGRDNKNRLRFHRIKVYGQRFPGTIGTDAERAITATPDYRVCIDGNPSQWGRLAADGSVEILIPGGTEATLETLGTTYEIEILHRIEPHDTLLGSQRRLNLLGYYEAKVDDKYGARTDAAALDFQADNGLDPDGRLLEATTRNKIRDVFGE
ncbi:MAG: peptidoglycan-binding domain-containing protein [Thermodesulfobacteriota bacterium]